MLLTILYVLNRDCGTALSEEHDYCKDDPEQYLLHPPK